MKFGQLTRAKVRKEFPCKGCEEPIAMGELSWGMRYYARKNGQYTSWMYHLHIPCLVPWVDSEEARRKATLKAKVTERAGRPRINIVPENMKLRQREFIYINFGKERLLWAYEEGTRKHIMSAKGRIAKHILELVDRPEIYGPLDGLKLNFTRKDKQEAMAAAIVRREPPMILDLLQQAYGKPRDIAHVLGLEASDQAYLYGYLPGQEYYGY